MAETVKRPASQSERDGQRSNTATERTGHLDSRLVKLVRALARQAAEEDFAEACRQAARRRRGQD